MYSFTLINNLIIVKLKIKIQIQVNIKLKIIKKINSFKKVSLL
jgi:hypothetical protein